MRFVLLLVIFAYTSASHHINWNGNNWAHACDFYGNDMSNVRVRSENCGSKCEQTSGCTHFTWTNYRGGTCWMKQGQISKQNAFYTGCKHMVCGVASGSGKNHQGVLATRHDAHEAGACELPTSNYAVRYPVALGTIDSLKHLKFHPELCGQILTVNCGHGTLDIIVTNSNIGGGLDLYRSTWSKLTNNKPPGETSCSVQLSSRNAFNFHGARCFYKPGTDFGNAYYRNVGLLNTNGRRVLRATINGRPGQHRGDNPYFAFDFGPLDGSAQIIFTLNDGSTTNVRLSDCEYQRNNQLWS